MFLSWRLKRQAIYVTGFVLAIAVLVFAIIYFTASEPTCSDGKQNQNEEGVDCGGLCRPCVINPQKIVTLWTRVLGTRGSGVYEALSLVENPNLFYGTGFFKYTFKLYDENNVLVAIKEGESYLNPHEKFIVFSTGIGTGQRVPTRAFMEIEPSSGWQYVEKDKNPILVSAKTFKNEPFPSLEVKLSNRTLFAIKKVETVAVLYDEKDNAVAVSSSLIDSIPAESDRTAVFTWPTPFDREPVRSEVFARTNLLSE